MTMACLRSLIAMTTCSPKPKAPRKCACSCSCSSAVLPRAHTPLTYHLRVYRRYDQLAHPIIMGAFEGYNCTLFAYGQTASGKTYTLLGDPTEPGIIVRGVHDVFNQIKTRVGWEHCVRVSYIEIYNGTITDLLSGEDHLRVIEDPIAGPTVHNVCEQVVMTPQSTFELIDMGERRRHTGSTDMNIRSSRSHTLFRMVIESRHLTPDEDHGEDHGVLTATPRSTNSARGSAERRRKKRGNSSVNVACVPPCGRGCVCACLVAHTWL